jgi:hypothetical protein
MCYNLYKPASHLNHKHTACCLVCVCTVTSPTCADRLKPTQRLLPEVLQTKARLDGCPWCGEADLENICTLCHVFCCSAIMLTNIFEQKCGKCGYHTEYDGSEDFFYGSVGLGPSCMAAMRYASTGSSCMRPFCSWSKASTGTARGSGSWLHTSGLAPAKPS